MQLVKATVGFQFRHLHACCEAQIHFQRLAGPCVLVSKVDKMLLVRMPIIYYDDLDAVKSVGTF